MTLLPFPQPPHGRDLPAWQADFDRWWGRITVEDIRKRCAERRRSGYEPDAARYEDAWQCAMAKVYGVYRQAVPRVTHCTTAAFMAAVTARARYRYIDEGRRSRRLVPVDWTARGEEASPAAPPWMDEAEARVDFEAARSHPHRHPRLGMFALWLAQMHPADIAAELNGPTAGKSAPHRLVRTGDVMMGIIAAYRHADPDLADFAAAADREREPWICDTDGTPRIPPDPQDGVAIVSDWLREEHGDALGPPGARQPGVRAPWVRSETAVLAALHALRHPASPSGQTNLAAGEVLDRTVGAIERRYQFLKAGSRLPGVDL